ncbi:MAG: COX15/CtaA family protein [Gemmatimonadetes bacterium]|nr:COX15/CtaA family protein [Gemmatimonadota bacterium]
MTAIGAPHVGSMEARTRDIEDVAVAGGDRAVHRWLVATAVCVVVALVVGGITRLTESGLSITEWRPVSGVVPPLSETDWTSAFEAYRQIPEAQTVHRGITLAAFKALYWWEWVHRILARLVGLVIAVPFFVLLMRRQIRPALQLRLANLPILVAAQGVLGWYMVQSGLSGRTDVSPYRLVAHLGVALMIYLIATWTAMTLRAHTRAVDRLGVAVAVLAGITILSGGFVAGLDAGHVYNEFPLMGSAIVPAEYGAMGVWWRDWFENPVSAQFNHRVLAVTTLVVAFGAWWVRGVRGSEVALRAWRWVAAAAALQVALGIATLLLLVPIPLAALHQVGALGVLTAGMFAAVNGHRTVTY